MGRVLGVGEKFPEFNLKACVSLEKGKEFSDIATKDIKGSWSVLFFWPLDFTFVCPTEIAEFNKSFKDFQKMEAKLIGVSCDSQFTHLAWRREHEELRDLQFPMLADYNKTLTTELGIQSQIGAPLRATFIVDPALNIRWVSVNDLDVGRNVPEVVRTLAALKSGGRTACNWQPGQPNM
jgi:lipoyl-dependent peroxiredoxin subunit C